MKRRPSRGLRAALRPHDGFVVALVLAGSTTLCGCADDASRGDADSDASAEQTATPCTPQASKFGLVYDPSVGETESWYFNDHSSIRGRDGLWHVFAITHAEPAVPEEERIFAHATSRSLNSASWTKQAPALIADESLGERLLWAPHLIEHEGTYYMFYCAGGEPARFQIKLATSPDLSVWTRAPGVLFEDGAFARDPFVMRQGSRWVLYYTATSEADGGHHVVAYRLSDDLRTWGPRHIAYTDSEMGTGGGPTESPFVVSRAEGYYLFLGPRNAYVSTEVFFSRDPLHFEDLPLMELASHAAEVIEDSDGAWYVSHAGWLQGGLHVSPLVWSCD